MASSGPLCGVCDQRNVSTPANIWCSDCDEGFCTDCSEHHQLAKISRYHTATPIEDYKKLPGYIQGIEQFCKEHANEKFILFCKNHDIPCCRLCIVQNHKQCQDVKRIEDVIQNVKTSNAFQETEQILTELNENIQKIKKDQEENLVSLEKSRIRVEKEIQKFRVKVNDHLDQLQENIIKELTKAEETERNNIKKTIDQLGQKGNSILEFQTNVSNIKENASELQAYLAIKQIQQDVDKTEAVVDSLVSSDKLQQKVLSMDINSAIKDILSSVKSFGNIVMETKGPNVLPTTKKNKQAQLLVPHRQRTIHDITLQLQQSLKVKSSGIFGCCMLPDGRLVFTDFGNETLIFMNADGRQNTTINLPSTVCDVIYIKYNNSLVVTSGSSNTCITLINIRSNKFKVEDTIKLDTSSYGIAEKDNTLYFCTYDSIKSLNLTNKTITKITDITSVLYSYIAILENNLYHTNNNTHIVTCYDLSGQVMWEFKDESIIKGPRGISVDNQGNVYVAGNQTSNVVIISPDGQKCRELLSTKDKLLNPRAIHYDRSSDNLLVTNYKNKAAFIYRNT